ncbi:MAG: alpha/beta hydrolase [Deltaproteobacteria bacterium]
MWLLPLRLGLGLLVFGVAACAAVRAQHVAHPVPDFGEVVRDLPYVALDDGKRVADVYRPHSDVPLPAIVFVHGGSWTRGDRRRMERIARRAQERGYVAVNIEYRLAPEHRHPAQLEDVLDAVCWVRRNAAELGVDPERIGLWGYSAGAHLSMLAATRSESGAAQRRCPGLGAEVQACVGGSTPTDLRSFGDVLTLRNFLGGSPEEIAEVYEDASPILAVDEEYPPTFLYHGTADWIVDIEHSRRFRDALVALGVPVELVETDQGHFSGALFADESIGQAFDFLDRYLRGSS